MSNKVTIEIDRTQLSVLKDYFDSANLAFDKQEEYHISWCKDKGNDFLYESYHDAEKRYHFKTADFFEILRKFIMNLEFEFNYDSEPASEESDSSIDNISSNDASNNDTSSDDVVNEDDDELPFPMDDAPSTSGLSQRVITVSLSDEDCDRLTEMCGVRDITVDVMLQNFICDLVKSDWSNSPDDIINANLWFDNCWFSQNYKLLLGWLLSNDFDPYDDLICYMESIEKGESDLLVYEVNPGGFDPKDIDYLKEDIKDWKEHIGKIRRQFLATYPDANWTCEFEDLETWYKERELFKNIRVR